MRFLRNFRVRQGLVCCILVGAGLGAAQGLAQSAAREVHAVDGRDWSLRTSGAALPWAEAEAFCDTLEAGGFSDWRLPMLAELEQLHDPAAQPSIRGPFALESCCAWSAENLATLPAERKGELPAQSGAPEQYYWAFLFDGGVSFYSNSRFADAFALCTRGRPANAADD